MADRMNIKFTIQAVDRFTATMTKLERKLDSLQRKADRFTMPRGVDIKVNTDEADRSFDGMESRMDNIRRNSRYDLVVDTRNSRRDLSRFGDFIRRDIIPRDGFEIGANFAGARREAERTRTYMGELFESKQLRIEGGVDVDTAPATRKVSAWRNAMDAMARFEAKMHVKVDMSDLVRARLMIAAFRTSVSSNPIRIMLKMNLDEFRKNTAAFATNLRNMGEIFQGMFGGILLSSVSMISPLIANFTGTIGGLGAMIGTTVGATLGLASAFVAAGAGVAGYAAVAIPAISGVISRAEEIKKLDEQIMAAAKSGDMEKANELMRERQGIFDGMTKSQQNAHESLRKFKESYSELVSSMEPTVLLGFSGALEAIDGVLQRGRETIKRVAEAVNNLIDSFNANLDAPDVKAFFRFLEDYAAPSLENLTKAVGNFLMGFLNMMGAFGPLSADMSQGLLDMSERFRDWGAALSENEKFQAFVDYTRENWPKVRQIIGDAITGIIALFVGFAPYAEDWMTRIGNMMKKFKEFAEGLGENQQFQEFIAYIRDNAPLVTTFIGNVIETLVQLGIAMAPVGVAVMEVANAIMEWIINFRQAHPVISNFVIIAFSLVGAAIALVAPFFAFVAILKSLWGVAAIVVPWIVRIGSRAIALLGPIGMVIAAVMLLITVWQNWSSISDFVKKALDFARNALDSFDAWLRSLSFVQVGIDLFQGLVNGLMSIPIIAKGVELVKGFVDAIKSFLGINSPSRVFMQMGVDILLGLLQGLQNMIGTVIAFFVTIGTNIVSTMQTALGNLKGVWSNITGAFSTGASKAASFVSGGMSKVKSFFSGGMDTAKSKVNSGISGIRGFFSNGMSNVQTTVSNATNRVKTSFSTGMSSARTAVSNGISAVRSSFSNGMSAVQSRVSNGVNSVRNAFSSGMSRVRSLVSSAVSGVRNTFSSGMSAVVSRVRSAISSLRSAFSSGLARVRSIVSSTVSRIKSLFKIDLAQQGRNIVTSLANGIKGAVGKVTGAIGSITAKIRGFLPSSPAKEGPLSDIHKLNFGGTIADSMKRQTGTVRRAMNTMMEAASPNVEYAVEHGYQGASTGFTQRRKNAAESQRRVIEVPVYLHGREIARASASDVTNIQDMERDLRELYSGGV